MYAEAARPPDAHVHTACYNLRKPSDTVEWSLYLCLSFCAHRKLLGRPIVLPAFPCQSRPRGGCSLKTGQRIDSTLLR